MIVTKLRTDGVSVAVTAGEENGDAYDARTTFAQADLLGCQRVIWPGAHGVYLTEPEGFVKALLSTLEQLSKKLA